MRAHGPLMLERFGDGELEGWSALQFIETSSITVHADEVFGRCFISAVPSIRMSPLRSPPSTSAGCDGDRAPAVVEPDEVETIAFFAEPIRDARQRSDSPPIDETSSHREMSGR